jgi:peptidoglycan hydrolase-like protein with peptidoglycan-binding domain
MRRYPDVRTSALDERMIRLIDRHYGPHGEIYVTAGTNGRHAAGSYHYKGMAVDFGAYDDTAESRARNQADLDKLALWLFDNFWDLTLELIHCAPSLPQRTYVKDRKRVGPYDAAAHVNHVHWAVSGGLMTMIEIRARQRWAPKSTFPLPAGHYYGPVELAFEHSGYVHADRPNVSKIQKEVGATQDGLYGSATSGRVKTWQRAHALTADGLVGPLTWHKMFPGA